MNKSENIGKLTEALSKAQGQIKGAVKDSANPFFKSTYADLSSIWDACKEPLSNNGLAVIQTTDETETGIIVETVLAHSSGEWIGGRLKMHPTKNDPQGIGSAITYARRYALAAIVGVCPEDDDANLASGNTTPVQKSKKPSPPPSPAPESAPEQSPVAPSFDDLKAGMVNIDNLNHLKNWWTKHLPEIKNLSKEDFAELTKFKDGKKEALSEEAK